MLNKLKNAALGSITGVGLGSAWDGLSPHLIANFYEVTKNDAGTWGRSAQTDPLMIRAPLTEASLEVSLNWQSPFENAGPESKAPALMAMLQSGALAPVVDALMGNKNQEQNSAQQQSKDFLKQFEGRTGITKLNSTQVFNGMPPLKIQVTALFRAWKSPMMEVEAPLNKLMSWALPVELSQDGSVLARAAEAAKGEMDYVSALMPSLAPTTIAMKYKGRTYAPLVIESISLPLASPIDAGGQFVELLVPISLSSLTAIDRKDWAATSMSIL